MAGRKAILRAVTSGLVMAGLGAVFACARRAAPSEPQEEQDRAAERLRAFDALQRLDVDFAHLPTWDRASGPDPYVLAPLPSSSHFVGALRGANAVVVLDEGMNEVARVQAPASPVALAVAEDGAILVAGELDSTLARFVWRDGRIFIEGQYDLGEIRAVRGIAAGLSGWVYVAEEGEGRLFALRLEHRGEVDRIFERREIGTCRGAVRLARVADRLIANCLLDHRLTIHRLEASGAPSGDAPDVIAHDGPIWAFDAVPMDGGLLVAAGGVEDHPLDRTIGAFGYIDSFLFLYRLENGAPRVRREATINLSELGVVTPKAIAIRSEPLAVTVAGYGSDKLVEFSFHAGTARAPVVNRRDFVPGSSAVVAMEGDRFAFANPLLDAWVVAKRDAPPVVLPVAARPPPPDPMVRLGEALFFTTLMAPRNRSDGALSRFTCETCHFEGYVDGRTHHTGRDDVHAVTKPLLGLFSNRPHFSRALDPDLTAVAFNEFRVAGAKSDQSPWFSISPGEAPWLAKLGYGDASASPETLRRALMAFLIAFQHRPNPAVIGRTHFNPEERRGAELFRDRCETCHEARLASDEARSRAAFDRWETLVMAREGAIVWGKDVYAKTGVVPYVHEKGARIPSLRRLYKKHPYFTNGSADSLDDLLARARFLPSGFAHDGPPPETSGAAAGSSERASDNDRGALSAPGARGASDATQKKTAAENQLDDLARRALLGFLRLL